MRAHRLNSSCYFPSVALAQILGVISKRGFEIRVGSTPVTTRLHQTEQAHRFAARLFCLVEMMGIEPMSENPLTKPSSWTVCYLEFPSRSTNRHVLRSGSPFVLDRLKGEPPMQVHCSDDVQSVAAVLNGGTGDPQVTALPSFTPKRKT